MLDLNGATDMKACWPVLSAIEVVQKTGEYLGMHKITTERCSCGGIERACREGVVIL